MRIKRASPIIRQVAIILLILLVGFLIAKSIGGPLVFWSLFVLLTSKVSNTGVNIWLARAIVVPMTLLLFYAIKFMLSWNTKKRSIGLILLCAFLFVGSLGMYYFTQNQYLEKWVGWGPNGYKIYNASGLDEYGEKRQKVTPDMARQIAIWRKNKGKIPRPIREKYQFFDPRTGEPIRWYYKYANGKIEIFDQPGFHPTYRKPLLRVNDEIVEEYLKQLEREETQNTLSQKPIISEKQPTYTQPLQQIDLPKKEVEAIKKIEVIVPTEEQKPIEPTTATEHPENPKQLPDDYKNTLAKYGNWMEDPDYGQVWIPNTNKEQTDWMPYQNGTWQDYGDGTYLWLSYEPFGYITYHFGRWQWYPMRGWYWIPASVWGPAWVEWYCSNDYVYWTPSWLDKRYFDSYSKYYYTKSDRKLWMGIRRNQLRAPDLLQITRTKKAPSVRINLAKITPNNQMTNMPNFSQPLRPNPAPPSRPSKSSTFRSLLGSRSNPSSSSIVIPRSNSQSRTANAPKSQLRPTIKQRQHLQPPVIRKKSSPTKKQAPPPAEKKQSRTPVKKRD